MPRVQGALPVEVMATGASRRGENGTSARRCAALLCLAAVVVALAAGLAAGDSVTEAEPNDAPANATLLPLGADASGSVNDTDHDYWAVDVPNAGVLRVSIQDPSPCAAPRFAFANNTTAGAMPSFNVFEGLVHSLVLDAAQRVLVEICPNALASGYWMHASLSNASAVPAGADEYEPNDDQDHANLVSAPDVTLHGHISVARGDIDVFWLTPAFSGYLALVTDGTDIYAHAYTSSGPLGPVAALGVSGWFSYYALTADEPVFVVVSGEPRAYWVRVAVAQHPSEFSQGPGESEPNDDGASATLLELNGTYKTEINAMFDPGDYFKVVGQAGEYIDLTVACGDDWCNMGFTAVSGPGTWGAACCSAPTAVTWLRVFLTQGADIVFGVTGGDYPEHYTITLKRIETGAYQDGIATLRELLGVQGLPISVRSDSSSLGGLDPFDLAAAEEGPWGPSKCAAFDVSNAPQGIVVASTDLFESAGGGGLLVPGRSITLSFETGWGSSPQACFETMPYRPSSNLTVFWGSNLVFSGAQGNASLVLVEVDKRPQPGAGALLALWAVTGDLDEGAAVDGWRASEATLAEARDILNASGVGACHTRLSAPGCVGAAAVTPAAEPPSPSLVLAAGVGSGVAVGAAILGGWRFLRRRGPPLA